MPPTELTPVYTPWGQPQSTRQIAPGVVRFDTASHGGYWVDSEHWLDFVHRFPTVQLYAGPQWFEEDEDWAWVYMAWPDIGTPKDLYFAVLTLTHSENGKNLPLVPPAVQAAANAWAEEHANHYWATGGGSAGGHKYDNRPNHWVQHYSRIKDNARRAVGVAMRVSPPFIATDQELDAIIAKYPQFN